MEFDDIVSFVPGESPFKRTLFEYYYSLENIRSLSAVAEKYNIPLGTVKKYCWRYKWIERIERRDQEINRIVFGERQKYIDQKKQLMKDVDKVFFIVRQAIKETLKAIAEKRITFKQITSPKDMYYLAGALKTLVETRLKLMGEAGKSGKQNKSVVISLDVRQEDNIIEYIPEGRN